jgi:hypothetical protein
MVLKATSAAQAAVGARGQTLAEPPDRWAKLTSDLDVTGSLRGSVHPYSLLTILAWCRIECHYDPMPVEKAASFGVIAA